MSNAIANPLVGFSLQIMSLILLNVTALNLLLKKFC